MGIRCPLGRCGRGEGLQSYCVCFVLPLYRYAVMHVCMSGRMRACIYNLCIGLIFTVSSIFKSCIPINTQKYINFCAYVMMSGWKSLFLYWSMNVTFMLMYRMYVYSIQCVYMFNTIFMNTYAGGSLAAGRHIFFVTVHNLNIFVDTCLEVVGVHRNLNKNPWLQYHHSCRWCRACCTKIQLGRYVPE